MVVSALPSAVMRAVASPVAHRDRRVRRPARKTIRCDASGEASSGAARASPGLRGRRELLVSVAVVAVAAVSPAYANASLAEPTLAEVTPVIASSSSALTSLEQSTVALFDKSTRSVVNVVDLTVLSGQAMKSGAVVPEGNGTGVVWDSQGHVVTNYHVLGAILSVTPETRRKNLECAKVTLQGADGLTRTFSATLVGVEKSKDLAVLKVNAPSEFLKPALVGDSNDVKVGQAVFAIGNPFGFDHTLTTGVVSGTYPRAFPNPSRHCFISHLVTFGPYIAQYTLRSTADCPE
jgi:S1-C subfamily serine protease